MISSKGTGGIAHTIHIATVEDGELNEFTEYENVLDVMNLPNGSLKFYFEGEEKVIKNGRIVRSTVRGIEDAFRYRCTECERIESDVISQQNRGDSIELSCHQCGETSHEKREIDDL